MHRKTIVVMAAGSAIWALLHLLAMTPAQAVTPLTPRLTDATHADLLAGLTRLGLPPVAHNSIVLALAGALGTEPTDGAVAYSTAHAHLPVVNGRVTRLSAACARVVARARWPGRGDAGAPASATVAIAITGTYCLAAPAAWGSSDQSLDLVPP